MTYSDETQKKLRENSIINNTEIAMATGDLIVAEDVITKSRRVLDSTQINRYLNDTSIVESKSTSTLLKG